MYTGASNNTKHGQTKQRVFWSACSQFLNAVLSSGRGRVGWVDVQWERLLTAGSHLDLAFGQLRLATASSRKHFVFASASQ